MKRFAASPAIPFPPKNRRDARETQALITAILSEQDERRVWILLESLLDLSDLAGRDGRRLGDAVRGLATWNERFAALDEFLLQRTDGAPAPAPEVRWAWRRLVSSAGGVPIGSLAREVGWSHKHLISKFRQQIGLPPKTTARLLRFEHVWRRLGDARPAHWDRIAADGGYSDQSHLIRDFREFTGGSPAEFLARSIPGAAA